MGINKNSYRVIKFKSCRVKKAKDCKLLDSKTPKLQNFIKVAVLASGGGTNLQALIDNLQVNKFTSQQVKRARILLVVSNNPDAYALVRAQKAGIERLVLSEKKFRSRPEYAKALVRELKKRKIDLVCLAGFMIILDPYFVRHFKNRMLNIHPALLPAFGGSGMYGHHVHEAVLNSGAKVSGCTVHFVDEGCDTGPIVLQKVVPVLDNDTPQTLAKRILKFEHQIYPEAVKLFAEGRLKIEGKRVKITQNAKVKSQKPLPILSASRL